MAKKFIGGRGFNSKTLLDECPPNCDPFSPENRLCIAPGPFSGTKLPLTCRTEVSCISAYAGILGDGSAGGMFAFHMKRAGYDHLVIHGKSDKPVYLYITDTVAELRDASDLWGKSIWDATDILKNRHGMGSVMGVGQAGENLVRSASTMVDKYASAAKGSGAVWGAKLIKAVFVAGKKDVPLVDPDTYNQLAVEDINFFRTEPKFKNVISKYGTHIGMAHWKPGYKYWDEYWEEDQVPENLRPDNWKKYECGRHGCLGCPIQCKNAFKIPEGHRRAGEKGAALEYEAIMCMGTNCGIKDPVTILEMENLADMYGMDVIALGNDIALAKELYNKGVIDDKVTEGLKLDWDNNDNQVELIHRVAMREGFGNLLAEGFYPMAKIIGPEAMKRCYHVKGVSRGPHNAGMWALSHAISTRGADHLRGRSWAYMENDPDDLLPKLLKNPSEFPASFQTDPVVALTVSERATTLTDCIGRCKGAVNSWTCSVPLCWKFPLWGGLIKLLTAATGLQDFWTPTRLVETADRVYLVERLINIKQGCTREEDAFPQKPDVVGTPEGLKDIVEFNKLLEHYYELHGYDLKTGVPTTETAKTLDLTEELQKVLGQMKDIKRWDGPQLLPLDQYPHGGQRS
eukprot:TRINITY_DN2147_c0_g1_i2.p1 TRINITY_DN2147_c0_g1~~TRINITY_DN2147_c0_g1_i2.p1  ORF type:complete len:674 (+),score=168.02 TRINITY_DN2147_c0_g1_i2:139-2022(+)